VAIAVIAAGLALGIVVTEGVAGAELDTLWKVLGR